MNAIRSALAALLAGATLLTPPTDAQAPAPGKSVAGSWGGALEAGTTRLRLKLIVQSTGEALSATFVSVDQGGASFPATVRVQADSVSFHADAVGAGYRAVLSVDGDTLAGVWSQGAGSLPLVMVRGADAAMAAPPRPQEPRRPFPYREETVSYTSAPGVRLAGTLTLPAGDGPHPAVLLVTGSGPQDRDETIYNHKPFAVLADYLTRRGIAVLRVDDRGVGLSTGSFGAADSEDFADDALAGVRFLDARRDVGSVGIVGHSEGGLIAPMVAARAPEVGFIVMLAGPGTPSAELLMAQTALIIRAGGAGEREVERTTALQRELFAAIAAEADSAALHGRLTDIVRRFQASLTPEERAREDASDAALASAVNQLVSPWSRWFLRYDPAPALRATRVPVLALNGALDLQVPADENLAGVQRALQAGGNRDVTVEKLPGLNHLFQTARTGAPSEYGEIEETFSPAALQKVGDWIVQRFGPRP
ncbi:MAG TPA: alpha/beta fold hydrolase [Longimicrobium sp.]|nr:alpha/beta fold hydrolase [Longimicrobium sp.]